MKNIFAACCMVVLATAAAMAQDVDLNKKTGLVTVDGKPAFFLTGKNKILWQSDYSVENMAHEELAYLKAEQGRYYNNASGAYADETYYSCTFPRSGNYCEIHGFTSLSVMKSLAKAVASAGLVQDGQVSEAAERKFIVMHNGVFLRDPNAPQVVVVNGGNTAGSTPAPAPVQPVSISIKADKIYNGDEQIATFRQTDAGTVITISIYSADDSKIAEATHKKGTDDDWNLMLARDGKISSIRYHSDSPLVKLFQYLAEKSYL